MAAQKYALFPPDGACNEPLPVHLVKDEFVFVQLAPMEAINNGEPAGKLTMPKDVIFPERVAELKRRFPEVPYEVLGKGPGIWLEEWRKPVDPRPSGYPSVPMTDVSIDDVSSFIAKPVVTVGDDGEGHPVMLDEENIHDLLSRQPTIARIHSDDRTGESPVFVRITPSNTRPFARSPVIISNVNELLATRRITINGQDLPASLTSDNVAELAQGGVTMLRVGTEDCSSSVIVMNRDFCSTVPGAQLAVYQPQQTAVARSAISASSVQGMIWQRPLPTSLLADPNQLAARSNASFFADGSLALYLPYRVTWELLGYTRGELLNTISLAPEESTTIEITTWDRRREEAETSDSFETQSTAESSFNAKLTAEAVNDLSHKHDWGLNVHGDVSIPIQAAKVGIGGAWNDSQGVQDTHKGSVTLVQEGLTKVTSQLKTSHQTKVTQSRETGFDRKNTRQIKNSNMCHTLDLDYFEVLASYQVSMSPLVNEARVCLLVKNPIKDPIEPKFLLTYESELRSALLTPEHDKGFAAARKLAALGHVHGYECILRCPEPCPCDQPPPVSATGTPAPATDPVAEATKALATAAANVRARIKLLNDANVYRDHASDGTHSPSSGICALARDIFNTGNHPQSEWDDAIDEWRRWLFREIHLKRHATGFWSESVRYLNDNNDTPERLELLIKQGEVGWATALNQVVAVILSAIQVTGIAVDLTKACLLNIKPLLDHAGFDDAGLDGAMKQAGAALESYNTAKATAAASQVVKDSQTNGPSVVGDKTDKGSESWPYQPKELAEARVAQDALLAHITTHECYYRQAIWASLGVDDRLLILRLMNDLPRYVDPQVVGFLADDCALPLRLDQFPNIATWLDKNVVHNPALLADPTPFTVTLPTSGVTVETSLGQCSTCEEFIENHRTLDLAQKSAEVDLAKERVEQEKLETKRYQARLNAANPLLADPEMSEKEPVVRVVLEKPES